MNIDEELKIWNNGYVHAMRDVLDWIDYDLKVRHSYAHVVADITKRAGTAINEIEGEKK